MAQINFCEFSKIKKNLRKFFFSILIAVTLKVIVIVYDFYLGPFYFLGDKSGEIGKFGMFLSLCLIGPIVEEIAFRYHIGQNDLHKIYTSLSFFLGLYIIKILSLRFADIGMIQLDLFSIGIAISILSTFRYFFLRNSNHTIYNIPNKVVIIITSILFSMYHLPNIGNISLLEIFYVLPYFLIGVVWSLVRLKFGFLFVVISHMAFNFIALLSLFLL